jgi:hypothetical protein
MMFHEPTAFAEVKFTRDRERLRAIGRTADRQLFEAFEQWFQSAIVSPESRALFLSKVPDWASSSLQLSAPKGVVTDNVAAEFSRQVADLLTTPPIWLGSGAVDNSVVMDERLRLRRQMVDTFKLYDVWNSMLQTIRTRDYVAQSRLLIDCGYQFVSSTTAGKQVKLFHALDIENDTPRVSQLAEIYPQFAKAYSTRMAAQTTLTVIGKDWKKHPEDVATENFDLLTHAGIDIRTITDVPELAAVARLDLGLHAM